MKNISLILISLLLASCFRSPSDIDWLNCSTILDTTLIDKDWQRGVYAINDTLILSTGLNPFDTSFCSTIELRIEPIISYHGKHICSMADLRVPFKIVKPTISDTLIVLINNKQVLFKIPEDQCE